MKTSKNELLSAWLDDEAGEFERRRLSDELGRDEDLAHTLGRYALVGEVMRSQTHTVVSDSTRFLAGIQAQLDDEPAYDMADTAGVAVEQTLAVSASTTQAVQSIHTVDKTRTRWGRQRLGYALAASVAVATLAGVLWLQNSLVSEPQMLALAEPTALEANLAVQLAEAPASKAIASTMDWTTTRSDSGAQAESQKSQTTIQEPPVVAQNVDQDGQDILKQYITLHMQHRSNNAIVPPIQVISYAK